MKKEKEELKTGGAPVPEQKEDITVQKVLQELQEVKGKLARLEAGQQAQTDKLTVKGNSALKVVNPADKPAYASLVDRYAKQNPVKFAAKKAALEAKLNS
jgi:hypothetical protein